ncbi:helix-turn-helix domain-containing protein [Erwinia sp. S43]|uniref:LexA family protein n=1 Tax=Erwinia sp. S43 TaxID=2769339 RepID=UPI00190C3B3B|nr:S24 family peptidase [Erwinia sp. S43]MBK0032718.1 helix-turn-helix domain-containing protein [Erwinia sp. S43]
MKTEMNDRIRQRRTQLELTQLQLAKQLGVSRVSVTKWENGSVKPAGENLHQLALALSCSPEWILYGTGDQVKDDTRLKPVSPPLTSVPVISSVQAGAWTDSYAAARLSDVIRWCSTTVKVSDDSFALDVRGESMTNPNGYPSIPEGSTVIVEPHYGSFDDLNGKIVVAITDGSSEATVKKLVMDGPYKYLMPLNPLFKPIQCDDTCRILGKVVQVLQEV